MSDKNTTSKLPKYKKTIDTTGFGLSCVTEYGFDDAGLFHHSYTYNYKNRKVAIQVMGSQQPRQLAYPPKRLRLLL